MKKQEDFSSIKVKKTDGGLITKRQAKEAIYMGEGWCSLGEFYECGEFVAIDKAKPLPIQPQAKIEVAIRAFEERAEDFLTANGCDLKGDFADLLRWVLGQPQDTWKDSDFGLDKDTPKQKGG